MRHASHAQVVTHDNTQHKQHVAAAPCHSRPAAQQPTHKRLCRRVGRRAVGREDRGSRQQQGAGSRAHDNAPLILIPVALPATAPSLRRCRARRRPPCTPPGWSLVGPATLCPRSGGAGARSATSTILCGCSGLRVSLVARKHANRRLGPCGMPVSRRRRCVQRVVGGVTSGHGVTHRGARRVAERLGPDSVASRRLPKRGGLRQRLRDRGVGGTSSVGGQPLQRLLLLTLAHHFLPKRFIVLERSARPAPPVRPPVLRFPVPRLSVGLGGGRGRGCRKDCTSWRAASLLWLRVRLWRALRRGHRRRLCRLAEARSLALHLFLSYLVVRACVRV